MYEQGRLWLDANVAEDLMDHVRLNEVLPFRIDATGREMRGRVVHAHHDGLFGRLLLPMKPEEVLAVPASAEVLSGLDGAVARLRAAKGAVAGGF